MFQALTGYSLVDLVLFDWSTFAALFDTYNQTHQLLIAGSLIAQLIFSWNLDKRWAWFGMALLTGGGWVTSGSSFYLQSLRDIYWPSFYFGLFGIVMGVGVGMAAMRETMSLHDWEGVGKKLRTSLIIVSLLPVLWAFNQFGFLVTVGTHTSAASVMTLLLFAKKGGLLPKGLVVGATLWLLLLAIGLWVLKVGLHHL